VLNDNGSDSLTIGGNGAFRFNKTLSTGATYAVDIQLSRAVSNALLRRAAAQLQPRTSIALQSAVSLPPSNFLPAHWAERESGWGQKYARLSLPVDMARDANGNLYVVGLDHTVRRSMLRGIQLHWRDSTFWQEMQTAKVQRRGSPGCGPSPSVRMARSTSLMVMRFDVSVLMAKSRRCRKTAGEWFDRWTGTTARFTSPSAIRLGPNGSLLVADGFSGLRSVDPTGTVSSCIWVGCCCRCRGFRRSCPWWNDGRRRLQFVNGRHCPH